MLHASASLADRVCQECRQSFMEKELVFAVATELAGPAPVVQGDPLLLYSMLHNLVKNAAEAVAPGGTGLGTYSALLIAKAHGGSIAMHSTPTDGTRIDIRLPQMKSN